MLGASGPAVRAWRAAESSPWWTNCRARRVRCLKFGVSGKVLRWPVDPSAAGGLAAAALRRSAVHSPSWNWVMRKRQSGLEIVRIPGGRWSNMRGRSSQSFHDRRVWSGVVAWRIASKAKCMACRMRPFKNVGGL